MIYSFGDNCKYSKSGNSNNSHHSFIPLTVLEHKSWSKKTQLDSPCPPNSDDMYDVPPPALRRTSFFVNGSGCLRKSVFGSYCSHAKFAESRGRCGEGRRLALARVHYRDPDIHEYARIPGGVCSS